MIKCHICGCEMWHDEKYLPFRVYKCDPCHAAKIFR